MSCRRRRCRCRRRYCRRMMVFLALCLGVVKSSYVSHVICGLWLSVGFLVYALRCVLTFLKLLYMFFMCVCVCVLTTPASVICF